MAGSLNQVNIIGTLGKDPEIRTTPSGKKVANFAVATNEIYKDKNGETQTSTEWHRIVAWGGLADIIEKYLKKGNTAYFGGKLTTRSWDDPESGQKKYSTEVVLSNLQLLGSKQKDQEKGQSARRGETDNTPPYGDDDLPF